MADAGDLKSPLVKTGCGFESRLAQFERWTTRDHKNVCEKPLSEPRPLGSENNGFRHTNGSLPHGRGSVRSFAHTF
jgi:hypothetical protein